MNSYPRNRMYLLNDDDTEKSACLMRTQDHAVGQTAFKATDVSLPSSMCNLVGAKVKLVCTSECPL